MALEDWGAADRALAMQGREDPPRADYRPQHVHGYIWRMRVRGVFLRLAGNVQTPSSVGRLNIRTNMPMSCGLCFSKKGVDLVTVIVVLAMIFALLALRLYSVLGKRTGHEQRQLPTPVDDRPATPMPSAGQSDSRTPAQRAADSAVAMPAHAGVRAIIAADRSFDVGQFLGGAQAAYGMILEAFWKGDRETLRKYCASEVYEAFSAAIDQREADGLTMDNKLVRIDNARIDAARVEGNVAYVSVHFEADLSAVTRDSDGNVVAGSMDDAISTVETWTFSRDLSSCDPNWELAETDEG